MKKLLEILTKNLIAPFLLVGLVPLVAVGAFSLLSADSALNESVARAEAALRKEVTARLGAIRDEKRAGIERYFQSIEDQIKTFGEDRMVIDAMREFRVAFRDYRDQSGFAVSDLEGAKRDLKGYYSNEFDREYADQTGTSANPLSFLTRLDADSIALQEAYIGANPHPLGSKHQLDRADGPASYHTLHAHYHPAIRSYLDKFGYYDIFLVDPKTGDIVYSVFKELDYSTSLVDGPFAQTNFGRAFREANHGAAPGEAVLVDYEQYTPSYEAPASFIASPIYDGDEKLGVAVFQMPLERITAVMAGRSGLGETGEVYLVGPDRLPRSDAYRDPDARNVVAAFRKPTEGRIETPSVEAALSGGSGIDIFASYHGDEVLSAHAPVAIGGHRWAIVAEIATDEAFAAVAELADVAASTRTTMLAWTAGLVLAASALIFLFARAVSNVLKRPINEMLKSIEAAAAGDLRHEPEVDSEDEIGRMAKRFGAFLTSLRSSLSEIKTHGADLNDASRDLSQVAGDMAGQISQMHEHANNVNGTTTQLTANISTVAAAVEQSSTNVQNVAAAVEEMSTSLGTVSSSVEGMSGSVNGVAESIAGVSESLGTVAERSSQAADISTRAAESAKLTNDKVKQLGESAQEIGHVVGVINDIAEQTNLLALNATIEAASAGEAGRGFAVVANEVKELAKQTASATDEIRQRIQGMQENTEGSVSAIQEIVGIIDEINEISQEIAVSVADQRTQAADISSAVAEAAQAAAVVNENVRECSSGTTQIAQNAEELSTGSNEIAQSAAEASTGAKDTSESICSVSESIKQTADGASRVDESAKSLSNLAHQLHELVGSFQV
jgi:methyl-accepting chemotaxis protein